MNDPILRIYAIVRADLEMPAGKLAAQAGHAFLDAYRTAPPEIQKLYGRDEHGTKVVLQAPTKEHLLIAYLEAKQLELPCALIVDSGHVLPPHFDGTRIVTAVGIGPVLRSQVQMITNRFKLV